MTKRNDDKHTGPPPHDELDELLRSWHAASAERAIEGRDRLLQAVASSKPRRAVRAPESRSTPGLTLLGLGRRPWLRAAASLVVLITLVALLVPLPSSRAVAETIMAQEAGRLDAMDEAGNLIGICPLRHTDVNVDISGRFTRVTLRQSFSNPHPGKIEAVYTFPLSHRGAVDRMQMTVGDRVVVGEVKERQEARRIYEAARKTGYVAGLLEQQRPNIFTQSVANIEPGAEIEVEISYVEMLEIENGVHKFDFPMVVAPRYVPGSPAVSRAIVPEELKPRYGIILRGPAEFTLGDAGDTTAHGALGPGGLKALMTAAQPVDFPGALWWGEAPEERGGGIMPPTVWYPFVAEYTDGSREAGVIFTDGTGHVNRRYFYTDPAYVRGMGTGFEPDTDQVPDASRITPMPVRPPMRAGHDISLSVSIDTGGPAITEFRSELHAVREARERGAGERGRRLSLELADEREIPNRDFVLEWRVADEEIEESHFVHRRPPEDDDSLDGYFTLVLDPPGRVEDAALRARELIFVLDCSGSMEGHPIEKAKSVLSRALATMRPGDRFNVVTFNESSEVLWDVPRPNTEVNRAEAQHNLDMRQGGGGTEMRSAVLKALQQPEIDDVEWPRARFVLFLSDGEVGNDDAVIAAVREHAGRSRMFTVAIGSSPNRSLLDAMASTGRGAADYVSLEGDADAAVARFVDRIDRPVLTDIELSFGDGLEVVDCIPPVDAVPDLFDERPLVIHGRYSKAGEGTLTIRGNTARGPYERVVPIALSEDAPGHDVIATLWARAKVNELEKAGDPAGIIALGEEFQLMTKHTSFVAVEKSRMTIDGKPMLVAIPIEMPEGQAWSGTFGGMDGKLLAALSEDLEQSRRWRDASRGPAPRALRKLAEAIAFAGESSFGRVAAPPPSPDAAAEALHRAEGEAALITAREHMSAGRWQSASEAYQAALDLMPGNVATLDGLREAELYFRSGASIQDVEQEYRVLREKTRGEFDQRMMRSDELLDQNDFDGALQFALTAQIQLRRDRRLFDESEYEERNVEAQSRLADIERAREVTRFAERRVNRVETRQEQAQSREMEEARIQTEIDERIVRIRELQRAQRFDEAIAVTDEILFFDESQPTALMLKEVLESMVLYRDHSDIQRSKEKNVTYNELVGQRRMIFPRPNHSGPGMRGVTELMQYPEDWPGLSIMRTVEGDVAGVAADLILLGEQLVMLEDQVSAGTAPDDYGLWSRDTQLGFASILDSPQAASAGIVVQDQAGRSFHVLAPQEFFSSAITPESAGTEALFFDGQAVPFQVATTDGTPSAGIMERTIRTELGDIERITGPVGAPIRITQGFAPINVNTSSFDLLEAMGGLTDLAATGEADVGLTFTKTNQEIRDLDRKIQDFINQADITSLQDPRYHETSIAVNGLVEKLGQTQQELSIARASQREVAAKIEQMEKTQMRLGSAASSTDALSRDLEQEFQAYQAQIDAHTQDLDALELEAQEGGKRLTELAAAQARYEVLRGLKAKAVASAQNQGPSVPVLSRIPLVVEFFKRKSPAPPAGAVRSQLTAEEVVLMIAALVYVGPIEDARSLADALVTGRPDFDLGNRMHVAVHDPALTEAVRLDRITKLAMEAETRIEKVIADLRREAHLRRVLDQRFWPFANAADLPETLVDAYDGPTPQGTVWQDGGWLVTVLVTDTSREMRDALTKAGFVVEDWSRSRPLVVGVVPIGRLDDLALVEGVRRVEPTQGG